MNVPGGMPPKSVMKQVIVYMEPERHADLKREARVNRRSLGQQLLVRAFGLGFPAAAVDTAATAAEAKEGAGAVSAGAVSVGAGAEVTGARALEAGVKTGPLDAAQVRRGEVKTELMDAARALETGVKAGAMDAAGRGAEKGGDR